MILDNDLITLLNKYGINGIKVINNNPNVLTYGDISEVEKIIVFLLEKGITAKNIEKCPSVLSFSTYQNVKDVYNFFTFETELKHIYIEDCLHILSTNIENVKNVYCYVKNKYGVSVIQNCPSILSGDYQNIVEITKTLKNTIGLDIVKNNGGSILIITTSEEIIKIISIKEFNYDNKTKTYNKDLLTATTFQRTSDEIKSILSLSYWSKEEYKPLLTPSIWLKDAEQIKSILSLSYWSKEEYKPLLTSSIWRKDAEQIKSILSLSYWSKEEYKPLLTPSIWFKDTEQIKSILSLPYWSKEEYKPLLTPSIWLKDAEQIKSILSLSYWSKEEYKPLLTPSIWCKNAKQIEDNIEICIKNGLEIISNNPTLIFRVSSNELQAKINYLTYHNMPIYIIENGRIKINSIFGMSNKNMQRNYGISKKELIRDYLNIGSDKHVL